MDGIRCVYVETYVNHENNSRPTTSGIFSCLTECHQFMYKNAVYTYYVWQLGKDLLYMYYIQMYLFMYMLLC